MVIERAADRGQRRAEEGRGRGLFRPPSCHLAGGTGTACSIPMRGFRRDSRGGGVVTQGGGRGWVEGNPRRLDINHGLDEGEGQR